MTNKTSQLSFSVLWLPAQASLRRLGAQICGLYVEVEDEKFTCRLNNLLPLLEKEIHPNNFEDVSKQMPSFK